VIGLIGIDIYDVKPLPAINNRSTYGGNSGPAVRPIGLRCVSEISKTVKIPVSGIGGIDSWYNVIEYIMVGATTVQVCTAVMWYGFDIVNNWIDQITKFMAEQGYSSVEDMKGKANTQIGRYDELKIDQNVIAKVNMKKCVLCKRCEISCRDGAFGAIKQTSKQLIINGEQCGGCGLCMLVCPQNAISMT